MPIQTAGLWLLIPKQTTSEHVEHVSGGARPNLPLARRLQATRWVGVARTDQHPAAFR